MDRTFKCYKQVLCGHGGGSGCVVPLVVIVNYQKDLISNNKMKKKGKKLPMPKSC
jgi:hypothetical protein